jgi:hypothetical protein
MFLLEPVVAVGEFGEKKYPTFNYLKGFPINEILDSLKRHLNSFESPFESDLDAESKENHLAHVAWNALVALHVLKHMPQFDDRYKIEDTKAESETECNHYEFTWSFKEGFKNE